MIIDLALIGVDGKSFVGNVPADKLDVQGVGMRVLGPVMCEFFAQMLAQELIVSGSWSVSLELECARCGDFFSTTIEDSSFLRDYAITDEMANVDVTDDVREAVLLKLPHFPLCGEECEGLCPHCGKNLNKTACNCRGPDLEGTWNALNNLNVD